MRLLCLVLIAIIASGCNDVKNQPLTTESLQQAGEADALSAEESELLASYMMRTGMARALSGEDAETAFEDPSITLGEAIDSQREWVQNAEARAAAERLAAEEALARREEELTRLRNLVQVTVVEKTFHQGRYGRDWIQMTVSINNTSDREVVGVKGGLTLNDMFGDRIIGMEIKHDDPIAAGERVIERLDYDYNQFMNDHATWRSTDLDKMQIVWEPETIIFADGERLEIPAN